MILYQSAVPSNSLEHELMTGCQPFSASSSSTSSGDCERICVNSVLSVAFVIFLARIYRWLCNDNSLRMSVSLVLTFSQQMLRLEYY